MITPSLHPSVPPPLSADASPAQRAAHAAQTQIVADYRTAANCPRHTFVQQPGFVSVCSACGCRILPSIAAWYELGLKHAQPESAAVTEARADAELFGVGFIQIDRSGARRLPPATVILHTK